MNGSTELSKCMTKAARENISWLYRDATRYLARKKVLADVMGPLDTGPLIG